LRKLPADPKSRQIRTLNSFSIILYLSTATSDNTYVKNTYAELIALYPGILKDIEK
jgi:hypothetical protein